jgi:plastocyanin
MRFQSSLFLAAVVVSLAACGGGYGSTSPNPPGNNGSPPGNNGNPPGPVETNQVQVDNNTFRPASIKVAPNTTVQWTWAQGATLHNVTFSDAASGDQSQGHVFTKVFPTAGTFNYSCTIHAGMNGSVLVQ